MSGRSLALVLALLAPVAPVGARAPLESGVAGLVVTSQSWDEFRPWAKKPPVTRRALAAVVEGPYLLVAAQMVADATLIQLEKFGRPSAASARVVALDPEVDLALIGVDDPGFFDDLTPVRLAAATPTEGTLRTLRWKNQQLESSASRIKRFEVQEAPSGSLRHVFLLVQTDVSGGGWSEPVFAEERLVGLTVSQTEQTARVLPVEVIAAYLERVRAPGGYRGFPVLRLNWQVNEDPALTAFLGQTGRPSGVVVRQIPWGSSACGVIRPRDILLSLDGKPIDASGYYLHPRLGQLEFTHIAFEHAVGDVVPLEVLRGGKVLALTMQLREYPAAIDLIPDRRADAAPPYLIAGGLVLRELDRDYLRFWGGDWFKKAPLDLVTRLSIEQSAQRPGRRRVVVLISVLPAPYTVGYEDLEDLVVEQIDGRPIDGLAAAADALHRPTGEFHTIGLAPNPRLAEVVLDAATLESATAQVLEQYRIPAAMRLPAAAPPDPGPPCPDAY
ncbi:MAG TPA: hypothetical protein VJS92_13340 [Candidatus Polarisedimenticolaceae bacterium]|nr:hypothetical protein [Candidatus Polarisedimenticolaceae bacterium]